MAPTESKDIPDATVPGLTWRVQMWDDEISNEGERPDGDGFTPKQVAAYQRGDWSYVVVSATPVVDGTELRAFRDQVGGVEAGTYTMTAEDDTVTGSAFIDLDYMINGREGDPDQGYPVRDLIGESRAKVAEGLGEYAAKLATVAEQVSREEQRAAQAEAEAG